MVPGLQRKRLRQTNMDDVQFVKYMNFSKDGDVEFLTYEEAKSLAETRMKERTNHLWEKIKSQIHKKSENI